MSHQQRQFLGNALIILGVLAMVAGIMMIASVSPFLALCCAGFVAVTANIFQASWAQFKSWMNSESQLPNANTDTHVFRVDEAGVNHTHSQPHAPRVVYTDEQGILHAAPDTRHVRFTDSVIARDMAKQLQNLCSTFSMFASTNPSDVNAQQASNQPTHTP